MTNNSGKNSKTTTTTAGTAASTNAKELKIKIPLSTSEATAAVAATTTTAIAAAAPTATATATVSPDASYSSTADKKKDVEKLQQQQRFTSPTSPKPQIYSQSNRRASPSSNNTDSPKLLTTNGPEAEHAFKINSAHGSFTPVAVKTVPLQQGGGGKKIIVSVSISMKQNLAETQCTAASQSCSHQRTSVNSPKSPKQKSLNSNAECTLKVATSPKGSKRLTALAGAQKSSPQSDKIDDSVEEDVMEINDLPPKKFEYNDNVTAVRPRTSTMSTDGSNGAPTSLDLSPVNKSSDSCGSPPIRIEERDKSSKRKSNLNRSLNEEATPDGDESALRRRRRREMGVSRSLIAEDEASLMASISSPPKPAVRTDLSYHMEMARRGLDLATTLNRRRAQTSSPKRQKDNLSPKTSIPIPRTSKRCDTVNAGEGRKERSSEQVNRKLHECLEEVIQIAESVTTVADLTQTMSRLAAGKHKEKQEEEALNLPSAVDGDPCRPSPVKHATFVQEERIYYEPDPSEQMATSQHESEPVRGGATRSLHLLKSKSIERETAFSEPEKASKILRRKSTDCPPTPLIQNVSATPNHIVSILKKKDHLSAGESSSASSNASPVTFSSNVMDTPSKHKRAGILKKRSSLDESRYYSRSHSPDERSILIKSARRNSLEEVANGSSSSSSAQGPCHHGILKQSSYDSSKSDGCPSASREPQQPHSILKKKDSTSTPSDGDHAPKHVSISQAVILAAAELSAAVETRDEFANDNLNFTPNNEEYDIKSILKLDTSTAEEWVKPPKPILKKKSSGDSDEYEIKPILKTSRKSSREEFEFGPYSDGESQQEPTVKPILKADSPSKRRSLGETESTNSYQEGEQRQSLSPFLLKRRTRSLERQDQAPVIDLAAALNAIATSQALPSELVSSLTTSTAGSNVSVAERIKSVEKFLANQSGSRSSLPSENVTPSTLAVNAVQESQLLDDTPCSSTAAEGLKILKPSVIKRELFRDRFRTQPVTSDEKNFFKNNDSLSSPKDTLLPSISGSAFKPAQSLEGLGFAHLSSHGNQSPNATPSAFTLTRSFTQPLSSSLLQNNSPKSSYPLRAAIPVPVPLPRKSPAARSNLISSPDTHTNISRLCAADSTLSCNNQSIYEMSSLDQDVDMTENQEPNNFVKNDSGDSSSQSSSGVVRTNSVKARANMFQQMQEKQANNSSLNREERTSPRRAPPRHLSPSPPAANTDEPKTPNNPPLNSDDEIEPSALPLSERLKFFSSLSESGKRNSCSFVRSPPFGSIERSSSFSSCHYYMATTPRSSTTLSSASITPTPMECNLPSFVESPLALGRSCTSSTLENGTSVDCMQDTAHDLTDSRLCIKPDIVKTSPFLQGHKQQPVTTPSPRQMVESETTPNMKRIKLKTVGKLSLPSTFLSTTAKECSENKDYDNVGSEQSENSGPPKKIGKIKSPFIENCNQTQQKQVPTIAKSMKFDYHGKTLGSVTALASLENSKDHHCMEVSSNSGGSLIQRKYQASSLQINDYQYSEDVNTDSGKENVDTSRKEQSAPVVEIRRKFNRKANVSQSFNSSTPSSITRHLTPRSTSLNGSSPSSPQIDDKYAKYFGVTTSGKPIKTNKQQQHQDYKFDQQLKEKSAPSHHYHSSPPAVAVNRNVRLRRTSLRSLRRPSAAEVTTGELQEFEDIVVTDRELKVASREFDKLLHNDTSSLRLSSSIEVETIFSSIV